MSFKISLIKSRLVHKTFCTIIRPSSYYKRKKKFRLQWIIFMNNYRVLSCTLNFTIFVLHWAISLSVRSQCCPTLAAEMHGLLADNSVKFASKFLWGLFLKFIFLDLLFWALQTTVLCACMFVSMTMPVHIIVPFGVPNASLGVSIIRLKHQIS